MSTLDATANEAPTDPKWPTSADLQETLMAQARQAASKARQTRVSTPVGGWHRDVPPEPTPRVSTGKPKKQERLHRDAEVGFAYGLTLILLFYVVYWAVVALVLMAMIWVYVNPVLAILAGFFTVTTAIRLYRRWFGR